MNETLQQAANPALGVLIFALLAGLSRLLLRRWHESELEPGD